MIACVDPLIGFVPPTLFHSGVTKISKREFRMTDEFRIQHLASVIQKALKTSIKPDVIAREFSDNKTPFVTAQVSHPHNRVSKILTLKYSLPFKYTDNENNILISL